MQVAKQHLRVTKQLIKPASLWHFTRSRTRLCKLHRLQSRARLRVPRLLLGLRAGRVDADEVCQKLRRAVAVRARVVSFCEVVHSVSRRAGVDSAALGQQQEVIEELEDRRPRLRAGQ